MLLDTADRWRRGTLRTALRIPTVRRIFVRPELRIPIAAALTVVGSAAVSLASPALTLLLGAALFGVPHILSGLRHTALRRRVHPLTLGWVGVALVLGVAAVLHHPSGSRVFVMLCALAVGTEIVVASAPFSRKAFWISAVIGLSGLCLRAPLYFLLSVTHVHALGSLGFFSTAARRRGIVTWPMWSVTLVVAAAAVSGAVDPLLRAQAWANDLGPDAVVRTLGHLLPSNDSAWISRGLFLYAFGQSLHYAVWLRLMPEVDRSAPVPWSFRKAFGELKLDLRHWTWLAIGLCAIATMAMLVVGVRARDVYFVLVYFHIALEAAAFARLKLNRPLRVQRPSFDFAPGPAVFF